ncbi:hypothetical protein QSV08_09855 [Maribacter sp. BPC-D8]|uniref:toxin-antitoxin system YwqK family antitoxin n=1 Tax=Maribacter sp. BPC-D8 TaxID=3053613 RepID=UPI002B482EB6|nr:hypothetical protein [Maribacter sp. BPC-D8]WRI31540.1 hypothetical protein QSV08_09855 [Maribacter sp. BPC-D8]
MKKTIYIIGLIALSIISVVVYDSMGHESKSYHENGKLKNIGELKDSKKIGEWKWYYNTGELQYIGSYENGNEQGEWKEYYDNGKLKKILNYSKGIITGRASNYYENGQLKLIGDYDKYGIKTGKWEFYHYNGMFMRTSIYKNGKGYKNGKLTYYKDNGKLDRIEYFADKLKTGEWQYFDANGKLYSTKKYYKGLLISKEFYSKDGTIRKTINHFNGKKVNWDSADELNKIAWNIYENESDSELLLEAITLIKRSIELDKNYYNTDTYAALLYKTGNYKQALDLANESLALGKTNEASDLDTSYTTDLIKKIKTKLNK